MLEAYALDYYPQKSFTPRLSKHTLSIKDKILSYVGKDKVFLEIAPGHGDLAFALSKEARFIYTIDPSTTSKNYEKTSNMKHICGFFEKEFLKKELKHKVDCVIFRHLLEHICTPREFLEDIIGFLDLNDVIYIEVPNAFEIFHHKKFIDIYHDHCGYYTKETLISTMNALGCEFIELIELFEAQHIGLFFKKTCKSKELVLPFVCYDLQLLKHFSLVLESLNKICDSYKNLALYGSAAHAHNLINHLSKENLAKIVCAFDLNEDRIGNYLLHSKIPIKNPYHSDLKSIECILMAMPTHETFAFENEIMTFAREGKFQGDVVKTARGVELFRIKN